MYIKENPMLYSEDIKEFAVQIIELLQKDLIRHSKGSYSSPTFIVINEVEKWINKAKMVINYKKAQLIYKNR